MVLLNLKLISASHMNAALLWAVYTQRLKTIHVNQLHMWQLVRTSPTHCYHASLDSFDVFEGWGIFGHCRNLILNYLICKSFNRFIIVMLPLLKF